jgi:guanine nucleotide-binding protein G(i) subunit alpha
MGLCGSTDSNRNSSKSTNHAITTPDEPEKPGPKVYKLLVLGAGESGKSTLVKQIVTLFGAGYGEEERKGFRPNIHNNVIEAIKNVTAASDIYGSVSEENKQHKRIIEECKTEEIIDPQLGEVIKALWADAGIQETFKHRANFQMPDSAQYFLDRIDTVSAEGYIPSEEDVFRCRVRTTGIIETSFELDGMHFKLVDVGGQRGERRKWIHCFENVDCVIFVVGISEYDQTLYEDSTTNRMQESLQLFEEIVNQKWFTSSEIVLFLNKQDQFQDKINNQTSPLNKTFSDYEGNNAQEALDFITKKFSSKKHSNNHAIRTQKTTATDTQNIKEALQTIRQLMIARKQPSSSNAGQPNETQANQV